MSPFALSTGTAEARTTVTVGVTFSCWTKSVGCSSGVGDGSAGFRLRELGRRNTRFVFLSAGLGVGRGWKAFETDWPTFLKKSPTGSALAHGPLTKNSAATGNEIQREPTKDLIRPSAFNVKTGFSATIRTYGKQKIPVQRDFAVFVRTDNATGLTAVYRQHRQQRFRCNRCQGY